MKSLPKFLTALFAISLMAAGINHAAPSVAYGDAFASLFGLSVGYTIIKHSMERAGHLFMPKGAFADVVLLELWENELITSLRTLNRKWLQKIRGYDKWVGNNVIHLHEMGALPEVLIDNTTYPIDVVDFDADEIPISLHKYDTTNTGISDDQLYALPFDAEGSVVRDHRDALEITMAKHGLHKFAPAQDTAQTPVLLTTGADNGAGRKRMIRQNLVDFKQRLDNLEIPMEGRTLVLCNDHVNDLIMVDDAFRDRYHNAESGTILGRLYGFDIYEDVYNPVYGPGTVKKAFSAASAGTDKAASTFYSQARAARALGTVKAYASIASGDPLNRKSIFGYRVRGVIINKTLLGTGAIVSASQSGSF